MLRNHGSDNDVHGPNPTKPNINLHLLFTCYRFVFSGTRVENFLILIVGDHFIAFRMLLVCLTGRHVVRRL